MRFFKGFLLGGVVVGALAWGGGYNLGRGAPLLSNPLDERQLADSVRDSTERLLEKAGRELDRATGG